MSGFPTTKTKPNTKLDGQTAEPKPEPKKEKPQAGQDAQ